MAELGALHVLVNNAGIALQKDVLATSIEEWRHLMSINLDGIFLGTKYAIPAIAASGGGSIVNISSVAGIVAHGDLAAYSASKGGIHLLSKAAAISCGRAGLNVRVNSVHPAFLRTELLDEYLAAREDPEGTLAGLVALHPIGRLGEAEDVARGVLYLASDESRWVTGTELVIDGGYMAEQDDWVRGRGPEGLPRAPSTAGSRVAIDGAGPPGRQEDDFDLEAARPTVCLARLTLSRAPIRVVAWR